MTKELITWINIDTLRPMEINPRFIKDESFRKLQQSIIKDPSFMELRPVLANRIEKGLFIYAGTQRWKACKDLGWTTIPCIIEENVGEDLIKSRMMKDNIHAGVFDFDKLAEFDGKLLDLLDISELSNKKLDFGSMDKVGSDTTTTAGGVRNSSIKVEHVFNIIFPNQDEMTEFVDVVQNLPLDGISLEAFILSKEKDL